jgi:hypothetical protein
MKSFSIGLWKFKMNSRGFTLIELAWFWRLSRSLRRTYPYGGGISGSGSTNQSPGGRGMMSSMRSLLLLLLLFFGKAATVQCCYCRFLGKNNSRKTAGKIEITALKSAGKADSDAPTVWPQEWDVVVRRRNESLPDYSGFPQ